MDIALSLREVPGVDPLVGALQGLPPAWLVGGALRDLLRGARAVDLDVAIEGDAIAAAGTLAMRLRGESVEHQRFGTATVHSPALAVDLAGTRSESYERPGALPDVKPASLAEDLGRRDFSVNAMALGLSGERFGELVDPHGGKEDLDAGIIRVLHDASFTDDPTRLLRALRYEARLGAHMDPHTEALAREAIDAGAPSTVSGPRVRDELLDLLAEADAPSALRRMRELGLDTALDPALEADADLAASAALGCAETGADPVLAQLAALISRDLAGLEPWVLDLGLRVGARETVLRAARKGPQLAQTIGSELTAPELHALCHCEPPEALALALAYGAAAEPVLRYLADLRGVRLEISGADLVAEGIKPSPALGRALRETLRRKIDGEVGGRAQELELALRLAREDE